MKYLILFVLLFSFVGCKEIQKKDLLFSSLDAEKTGITFENKVSNLHDFNIFGYRNFYNGGGVAIGDINNDNLVDVYMVSNQNENKLFLNKGNWQFEDIT